MTDKKLDGKWDAQFRKGALDLAVLACLKQQRMYGLQLLNHLHKYESLLIPEGTLYPLLDRLTREGLVTASWVQDGDKRPRKYFELTSIGNEKLVLLAARWRETVADIELLLQQSM